MSAPLLKETQAHATRWLRWQLGDESDRPMPWELFADGLERRLNIARNVADQYISKANAHDAEVLGYRETIKALEEKLSQAEDQLASKDGYPAQPVDDGGPARDITLRDWFAGVAMQGLLASRHYTEFTNDDGPSLRVEAELDDEGDPIRGTWRPCASNDSFALADWMLAARNGKGGA